MDQQNTAFERAKDVFNDVTRHSDLTPIAILIQRMIDDGKLPFMPTEDKES